MNAKFPKRVVVGVGVALPVVLLLVVPFRYSPRRSPLRLSFVGFESRQEGTVAVFIITNTLYREIQIHGFERAAPADKTWNPVPYREGQVVFKDGQLTDYPIKPGEHRTLVVRVNPPWTPWRMGAWTTHKPSLVEEVRAKARWAWAKKCLGRVFKSWM